MMLAPVSSRPAVQNDFCSYCNSLVEKVVACFQIIIQYLCCCLVEEGFFGRFLQECPLLDQMFNDQGPVDLWIYAPALGRKEVNKSQAMELFNELHAREKIIYLHFIKGDKEVRCAWDTGITALHLQRTILLPVRTTRFEPTTIAYTIEHRGYEPIRVEKDAATIDEIYLIYQEFLKIPILREGGHLCITFNVTSEKTVYRTQHVRGNGWLHL